MCKYVLLCLLLTRLKMCLNTFISKMSLFRISYQLGFLLLQSSNVKVHLSVLKLSVRGLQWGCLVFSASKLDSHWKKCCDFSGSRWSSGVTRTLSVYMLIEGSVKRLNPFSTDSNCENTAFPAQSYHRFLQA